MHSDVGGGHLLSFWMIGARYQQQANEYILPYTLDLPRQSPAVIGLHIAAVRQKVVYFAPSERISASAIMIEQPITRWSGQKPDMSKSINTASCCTRRLLRLIAHGVNKVWRSASNAEAIHLKASSATALSASRFKMRCQIPGF